MAKSILISAQPAARLNMVREVRKYLSSLRSDMTERETLAALLRDC